jgi:hypothetical protein
MKCFLAFKYTNVFSRELDGTGVNVGDEIVSVIIERANARLIAEDLTQVRNIIGWSGSNEGRGLGKNYKKSVQATPAYILMNRAGQVEPEVERPLLILLIPIHVLRWTLSNSLDHLGELTSSGRLFYGENIYLMPPVVTKVEPVAESVINL